MDVKDEKLANALVVAPSGRLDSNTSSAFEEHLLARIDGSGPIVIDFDGLDYISSAGLRVLLMAWKKGRQNSARIALCAMKPQVREVFEISGFLSMFTVCDDRAQAVAKVTE